MLRPPSLLCRQRLPKNSILFSSFPLNISSSQEHPLLTVGGILPLVDAIYEEYPGGYIRPPCATRGTGVKSDSPASPAQSYSCATTAANSLQGQYIQSVHCYRVPELSHLVSLLPDGTSTFCSARLTRFLQITRCSSRRNVFRAACEKSRPLDGVWTVFERKECFIGGFQHGSDYFTKGLRAI